MRDGPFTDFRVPRMPTLLLAAALFASASALAAPAPVEYGPPADGEPFFAAPPGSGAQFTFRARTAVGFFDDRGLALVLAGRERSTYWPLRWGWVGSRTVTPVPFAQQRGIVNDFVGPQSAWRPDLPSWGGLEYREVSPGVSVVFEPRPSALEYLLRIAPGASTSKLRFYWEGATRVDREGSTLLVRVGEGVLREQGLSCYQPLPTGGRREVSCRYTEPAFEGARWVYGIALDGHDPALAVVVDPIVNYGTYLGGDLSDRPMAMAADLTRLVVVGQTLSTNMPAAGSTHLQISGSSDAFVVSYDDRLQRAWSMYLGSAADDEAAAVALTSTCAFVGGTRFGTATETEPFYLGAGISDRTAAGREGWVAKVCGTGDIIRWITYLGGSADDAVLGIVASDAQVFVVGSTSSPDIVTGRGEEGLPDGFVARLGEPLGNTEKLVRFGGASLDTLTAVALSQSGNVYVGGHTNSLLFPPSPVFGVRSDGTDAFACELTVDLAPGWCGVLAGNKEDTVSALAVSLDDSLYVAGTSDSSTDFPGGSLASPQPNGSNDAFVAKISLTPEVKLAWARFVGGSANDLGLGLAVDPDHNPIVVGGTLSSDFPLRFSLKTTPPQDGDAFFTRLSRRDGALLWSSLFGGDQQDGAAAAVYLNGNLYAALKTSSSGLSGTTAYKNGGDLFVLRIDRDRSAPVTEIKSFGTVPPQQAGKVTVLAKWAPVVDFESAVARIEFGVGSRPHADDVAAFKTLSSSALQATADIVPPPMREVVATLRVTNTDGVSADIVSGELYIEPPGPDAGVEPGPDAGPEVTDAGAGGDAGARVDGGVARDGGEAGSDPVTRPLLGWSCASAGGGGAWHGALLALAIGAFALARRR